MRNKLLIVDAAGLSQPPGCAGLSFAAIETVFPALTCPVQAGFRTGSAPRVHGVVSNGRYFRELRRATFWEQSASLVTGRRIWHNFRRLGGKVAILFWQQSLGEDADIVLSPAPIHTHHGGTIEDCYARPAWLYRRLSAAVGRKFKLRRYWGPMASAKVGEWIVDATVAVLTDPQLAPDLCLTYLPSLDYDLQRHDPRGAKAAAARQVAAGQLDRLIGSARRLSYEVVVFGDYAIRPVDGAVFPNRALAEAELFRTRPVKDMLYPDLHASAAFAMADHQIAHVYVPDPADIEPVRELFAQLPGVGQVMDLVDQGEIGLGHPACGELLLVAEEGTWFAYPWWTGKRAAPEYAAHVDIHNKPGYDPCELRFGWPPGSISTDTGRVRGSHGRAGPECTVVWAATIDFPVPIGSIVDLARATRTWLDEQ